jgi:hypothetical protein
MYDYEKIVECANELGVERMFSPKALQILLEYKDAGDDVIYPLIALLGEEAFTDEAKEYMK